MVEIRKCFDRSWRLFAGMAVLLQRHKLNAAFLTAWDQMAGFFGFAALMRLFDAVHPVGAPLMRVRDAHPSRR
jgi:hypothetical protein